MDGGRDCLAVPPGTVAGEPCRWVGCRGGGGGSWGGGGRVHGGGDCRGGRGLESVLEGGLEHGIIGPDPLLVTTTDRCIYP